MVIARAPSAGGCVAALEPRLGASGCARLQAVLVRRAAAWAARVAPKRAVVAYEPEGARAEIAGLVPEGVALVGQGAGEAAERASRVTGAAFELFGGPLLVAGTALPRLGEGHAAAALLDLAEGVQASFGPTHDGGWYLAALDRPRPRLLEAGAGDPRELELARILQAAAGAGLEVGLLRMERRLRDPDDAVALLADPLLPTDVRAALPL